jgi:MFS family permease
VFFLFSIGIVTGRLTDLGHFRPTLVLGSVLIVGGHLAISWASKYWQFLLAQGVCVGIGNGCLFNSGFLVVTSYFSKKLALLSQ